MEAKTEQKQPEKTEGKKGEDEERRMEEEEKRMEDLTAKGGLGKRRKRAELARISYSESE